MKTPRFIVENKRRAPAEQSRALFPQPPFRQYYPEREGLPPWIPLLEPGAIAITCDLPLRWKSANAERHNDSLKGDFLRSSVMYSQTSYLPTSATYITLYNFVTLRHVQSKKLTSLGSRVHAYTLNVLYFTIHHA